MHKTINNECFSTRTGFRHTADDGDDDDNDDDDDDNNNDDDDKMVYKQLKK